MAPNHTHKYWRTGAVEEFAYTGSTAIRAPGRYPRDGYTAGPGEPWNCMSACVRKPGPCVVCHGASKEWRHLGSVVFGPVGMNSTGLVCKVCLPRTFEQWLQIVSDLDVTAGEVKPKTDDNGAKQ